jgi:ABC-2 type transport system ATP-binding protein
MSLRIAVSVVLNSEPDVLLVDEILAAADERFRHQCYAEIEAHRAGGAAVVIVSHDLDMIEQLCSRVIILNGGELRFDGPTDDGLRRYREWADAG